MTTHLYITGATFDQVQQALTHATSDAHDLFNVFSFYGSGSYAFSSIVPITKHGDARSVVIAEKHGMAAAHYAGKLRERFQQVGLDVHIFADLDEAIDLANSDTIIKRESIPLTRAQWRTLERIAAETGSTAERGDNAGNPSWRTLLRRIADGELVMGARIDQPESPH